MLKFILLLPLLLVLVLFELSNTAPVRLSFWPTDYALELPLSIVVLVGAALAFVAGAVLVWISGSGARRRARRAEAAVRVLEDKVEELKTRLARPAAPPS